MTEGKPRARKDEEKQQRRQAILDTARQLFGERGYEAVTVADVANGTGLAKGTVYLYFKTKEEMFLAIHQEQLIDWFDDVDTHLKEALGRDEHDVEKLAELFAQTVEGRAEFTRLLAIIHTVLEQNIELEVARNYKTSLMARVNVTGSLLEKYLPFFEPGQGAELLVQIDALVIGLQHLADASPVVRQLFLEPDLAIMQVDFGITFARSIRTLLLGYEYAALRNPKP